LPLETVVAFRLKDDLKRKLEAIAEEMGLSKSVIARNNLRLVVDLPAPQRKLTLSQIVQEAKKERKELYEYAKDQ